MTGKIHLKRGKDKPLHHHHPWIFSGAIARVEDAADGDTVEVLGAGGEWLARAAFNSRSQIAGRVWTFEREQVVDSEFFRRRITTAFHESPLRQSLRENAEGACRLVNAESDFLPGVVIDRYAAFLVAQFLTLGAEKHKAYIVEAMVGAMQGIHLDSKLPPPCGIYERSDVDVRKKEGLPEMTGVLFGEEPPDRLEIVENGLLFLVDVKHGHKTGFYLDQRMNRQRAAAYLRGSVLNAFAYTGAFGVYAAHAGAARVVNLDASKGALELARENFARNGVTADAGYVMGDAFETLREYRQAGQRFDAIVLDPPKFATSQGNLERAARGYKDLNMLALQLLNPNGFLVTFSCSGLVDAKLFQQIVFSAAVDAKRDAQIVEKLGQSPDHPIGLNFPEGEYLKGLIVRAE